MTRDRGRIKAGGVQTLLRGLELLEAVGDGVHAFDLLAERCELSRSTSHRLLSALVQQGYLRHMPRQGYYLGPRLIELGFKAHAQLHLPSLARPHLQWLRDQTQETVNLGVLDGHQVVYIDKLPGRRELQLATYIGARLPVQCTALGKSLVAGQAPEEHERYFVPGLRRTPNSVADLEAFRREIRCVAGQGYAVDLEENETGIRCISAPICDASGSIVAAVSVTSAAIYLDDCRIHALVPIVREAARRISTELGWSHQG